MAGLTSGGRTGNATRDQTARQRQLTVGARLRAAETRDELASARDAAALARDQAADARGLAMAEVDAAAARFDHARARTDADLVVRAAGHRQRAAELRARAAEERAQAAQDRRDSARDRAAAAQERLCALVDREALAHQVAIAETDPLTGARSRAAGLTDLERELDRCRRSDGRLVVAYVDIVGLKAVNDSEGHAAGDELIQGVVRHIRVQLRTYDLIIRVGGDEFVCAMSDISLPDARERFAAVSGEPHNLAIRTGFAELESGDSVADVIARADGELIDSRNDAAAGPGSVRPGAGRQPFTSRASGQLTRPPR